MSILRQIAVYPLALVISQWSFCLISRVTNDDITPDQFVSFDDHVETSNTETDIARIVASRSTVDEEEGELEIPEAYNEDVKNSVKSYQEALSIIQQLEEFSKKKECTTNLQHLWMVKFEYEKQLTYQCKTVQTKIDNFLSVPEMCNVYK
jgi:hypothetical protein